MVKMKSERPLYVNGVASTEFETTDQHAKELEAAGRAKRVSGDAADKQAESKKAPAPENKMAPASANKAATAATKKQESK